MVAATRAAIACAKSWTTRLIPLLESVGRRSASVVQKVRVPTQQVVGRTCATLCKVPRSETENRGIEQRDPPWTTIGVNLKVRS